MEETFSKNHIFDIITASFLKRFSAWFIDQIIVSGLVGFLFLLNRGLLYSIPEISQITEVGPNSALYLSLAQYLILGSLMYFTFFEGTFGRTPGKKLLGVVVLRERGMNVGFSFALLRRIGLVIPFLNFFDGGSILINPRNQRLFDILAGTYVFEEKHKEKARRFLEGENIVTDLMEEGLLGSYEYPGRKRDKQLLEGLKEMKGFLEFRNDRGDVDEDEYKRLKRKYDNRIEELEKRLEEEEMRA